MFIVEVSGARSAWALPAPQALALGASHSLAVFGEARYETLVTASFLHLGIVHVAFDALLVWQAGPTVERTLGSGRMAPIALVAGALGNLLGAARGWIAGLSLITMGGAGALAGVIAAACVVAMRDRGWQRGRSPELGALLQWLAVLFAAGLVSRFTGDLLDPATLVGGALGGVALGVMWRRPLASSRATGTALAASAAVLLACIALVAVNDRADRFATMPADRRLEFTADAVLDGRCGDSVDGLRSLERLRVPATALAPLRAQIDAACGWPDRAAPRGGRGTAGPILAPSVSHP